MSTPSPTLEASSLVRVFTAERDHPYENMIICRDHLRQLLFMEDSPGSGRPFIMTEFTADEIALWNHRCLMCGIDPSPGRLCESADCRRPLHPQWPAVYCSNDCALDDV